MMRCVGLKVVTLRSRSQTHSPLSPHTLQMQVAGLEGPERGQEKHERGGDREKGGRRQQQTSGREKEPSFPPPLPLSRSPLALPHLVLFDTP